MRRHATLAMPISPPRPPRSAIVLLLGLLVGSVATAETWYRWVAPDGTLQMTRDSPMMGVPFSEIKLPDPVRWRGGPALPDELDDRQRQTAQAVFRRVGDSVYWLRSVRASGAMSYGSAVAVSESDALTNCHAIASDGPTTIGGAGSAEGGDTVDLVGADFVADRCVVRTRSLRLVPVGGLRRFDTLDIGEVVYAVGNPYRYERTLSDGLLSGKRQSLAGQRLLQTSAPISSGSSGGGLFDARGNLIGITTATLRGSQNLNFAIPAEDYWP
jgi:S1-C subfamily serine protease